LKQVLSRPANPQPRHPRQGPVFDEAAAWDRNISHRCPLLLAKAVQHLKDKKQGDFVSELELKAQ